MSTVVIGGGPRPQLRLFQVSDMGVGGPVPTNGLSYEIRDGQEIVAVMTSMEHAVALLKILQEGE